MTPDIRFVVGPLRRYLCEVFDSARLEWKNHGAEWTDPVSALTTFTCGGEELRSRFCFWGMEAVSRSQDRSRLLVASAALELVHAYVLIREDIMDESPLRRGSSAMPTLFAKQHRRQEWRGDATAYGSAAAMLTGDLALNLAYRLAAELTRSARDVWNDMLSEMAAGQFLDLTAAARGDRSAATAQAVARSKSARYTVTGPLRLGAAVGGRELPEALGGYGDLVGEAIQLRDDLLGVFGSPEQTGRPVGHDLRSGRPTLLLAYAEQNCSGDDLALLGRVGDLRATTDIGRLIRLLETCGARQRLEQHIDNNLTAANGLLAEADIPAAVRDALGQLSGEVGRRIN